MKIEESEKAGSRWDSNPGHLTCAASALPLSYNNWTTTSPHSPLYVYTAQVSSVAEHWLHKPGVLGLIPVTAGLFTLFHFLIIASEFLFIPM